MHAAPSQLDTSVGAAGVAVVAYGLDMGHSAGAAEAGVDVLGGAS